MSLASLHSFTVFTAKDNTLIRVNTQKIKSLGIQYLVTQYYPTLRVLMQIQLN